MERAKINFFQKIRKIFTCCCIANKCNGRKEPLEAKNQSQGPSHDNKRQQNLRKVRGQEGERAKALNDHEPSGQKPLPYNSIFVRENVTAAVKFLVKLIRRITKVFEAIFPQAHVFEATESFLVRLNPVRARNRHRKNKIVHFDKEIWQFCLSNL